MQPPTGFRIVSSVGASRPNGGVIAAHGTKWPNAVAVSIHGKCNCSEDGVAFTNVESGHIFAQGACVRTGENGWIDLFFRSTGATMRIQPDAEISVEKMHMNLRDGHLEGYVLLELRKGRIFTVVRSATAESTLEIINAAGRSVVEGSQVGRYIITADGTHVTDKVSAVPLKLISDQGITVIAAGEQCIQKDGKALCMPSSLLAKDLAQLNELQTVSEKLVSKELSAPP
jgi:hypothetical protein